MGQEKYPVIVKPVESAGSDGVPWDGQFSSSETRSWKWVFVIFLYEDDR